MKRWKQNIGSIAVFIVLGFAAWGICGGESAASAGTLGGAEAGDTLAPKKNSTDVLAGVVVDYMGRLQFVIRERATAKPVEGASVELYVPSLERYVLFGQSDEQGIYELDVTYGEAEGKQEKYGVRERQAKAAGDTAVFENNRIRWKVYKKGYLPYPVKGEAMLDAINLPLEVEIMIEKEEEDGEEPRQTEIQKNTETSKKPASNPVNPTPPRGKIPKTGVQQSIMYGVTGLAFCVIAGLFILFYRNNKKDHEKE